MRSVVRRSMAAMCISHVLLAAPAAVAGGESRERVAASLEALDRWLGRDANGRAWRRFLRSDELKSEVARRDGADMDTVAAILGAYESGMRGLERGRFVGVREALRAWLADLRGVSAAELPKMAILAKRSFSPVAEDRADVAKKELLAAIGRLDRRLAASGPERETGWKRFLGWSEMQSQLQGAGEPDLRILRSVAAKYYGDAIGLELPPFVGVREALGRYVSCVSAVRFSRLKNSQEETAKKLDELADGLQKYARSRSGEDAAVIGGALDWLERAGQSERLVAATRRLYWRPNVYVQVSERLAAAGFGEDVDDQAPVRETILGTRIEGIGRTKGRMGLELAPNSRHAAALVRLRGVMLSENVGYNGPARIFSNATTLIEASKPIVMDPEGFRGGAGEARCAVDSHIRGVAACRRLVRRIASRRAAKQECEAEWIASRLAERRVETQMEKDAADMLRRVNEQFQEKLRKPLLRRDAFPRLVSLHTSDSCLYMEILHASSGHIAAPGDPPPLSGDCDLAVRAHESIVSNFAASLLRSETLTDEKLEDFLERTVEEAPDELKTGPDKEPWSIDLHPSRPISAVFDDGLATVTIHGQRLSRGYQQQIRERVEISASYKVQKGPTGAKWTRQGAVDIRYPRLRRLGLGEITMKSFLKKKWEALFRPEFVGEGLLLPGRWKKAGKLQLQQLQCDDGWLVMGWRQPAGGSLAASAPQRQPAR